MWHDSDEMLVAELAKIASEYRVGVSKEASIEILLRTMGDELRSCRLRNELGQSNLPTLLVRILQEASMPERMEALRVMANLCIDHGVYLIMLIRRREPQKAVGSGCRSCPSSRFERMRGRRYTNDAGSALDAHDHGSDTKYADGLCTCEKCVV